MVIMAPMMAPSEKITDKAMPRYLMNLAIISDWSA